MSAEPKFPKPTHGPDSINNQDFYTAGRALSSLPPCKDSRHIGGRFGHLLNAIPPGLNYSFFTEEMGHPQPIFAWRSKFSDFMYKADPDAPVRTIKAQGGQYTGPFHWTCRHFTIDEYKRLQTFPDSYALEGNNSEKIRQIGNSVPPQLARILAIAIRGQFFSPDLCDKLDFLQDWEQLGFRKRKRELTKIYQEKAKKAIHTQPTLTTGNLTGEENFFINISKNFKISRTAGNNSLFYVEKSLSDTITIKIYDADKELIDDADVEFSINVTITNPRYHIPFDSVTMDGFSREYLAFTGAWKIFEMVLIENNIKADLVQLNGYYQYNPNMNCNLLCHRTSPLQFLVPVVNGSVTRRILDKKSLRDIWGVDDEQLREKVVLMKRIGYEIRNNMTNPQIPKDCWLIPYPFPTLNPLSVQLRKSIY